MSRIRLFPVVLFVLIMAFFIRMGHLIDTIADDNKPVSTTVSAYAEETEKKSEPVEDMLAQDGEEQEQYESDLDVTQNDQTNPFAPQFSDAELNVLQSLSERREELEMRARELDEKEKLLQITQNRIDEKISEMEGLRAEIEKLLGAQQKVEEERFTKLVKIYENMKPKDAANIFNELQFNVLIAVVDRMSERKTAPIFAAMDPIRARYLSAKLAEQKALPKPR